MKRLPPKRFAIKNREKAILLGLVDLYIKTNKPIGSHSLKLHGFNYLSSATIRNYFNKLEKEGFLIQPHSSGGRIPTDLAYREYVNSYYDKSTISTKEKEFLKKKLQKETKEIIDYLNSAAEVVSEMTQCSCCFTLPLFDQDFINDIKIIQIDSNKILCVLITDFGFVRTETIYCPKKLIEKDVKLLEEFFLWKLGKNKKPSLQNQSFYKLANHFYNEIIVRHIVGYKNFTQKDIHKTGLAKLLLHPEFTSPSTLASTLALFEDLDQLKLLLYETIKINRLTCWIGNEFSAFTDNVDQCTFISIPYYINNNPIGAIALLGPMRLNYKKIFGILLAASKYISQTLTKSCSKFKLTFNQNIIPSNRSILLEDKRKNN